MHHTSTHHTALKATVPRKINNTIASRFNQMTPLARTITAALEMSKTVDTGYIHKLTRKFLHTDPKHYFLMHSKPHLMMQNIHNI